MAKLLVFLTKVWDIQGFIQEGETICCPSAYHQKFINLWSVLSRCIPFLLQQLSVHALLVLCLSISELERVEGAGTVAVDEGSQHRGLPGPVPGGGRGQGV